MKTRVAHLGIAVAMLAATLIPSSPAMAKGGDPPPPEQVTILSGSGATTQYLDQADVEVFAVHDGHDLDQYLYRSSSPLDFVIEVDRDYGPVDADGHPAAGNALFGRNARLTLRAFDVDESYAGTDVEPEIDRIRVNGVEIDGQLSGADGQWSISSFSVPASLLQLPTGADPDGRNEFEVLIDTANVGGDVWAVEVDWAELRPVRDSGPRPVALLHGIQSGREGEENDMSAFRTNLILNYPELDGRVINPFLDTADSIEGRSALLQGPLEELLISTGAPNVNIAAHSYGGLVARRYAWDHRGEVNSVVMIATPNGGQGLADNICIVGILCPEDSSQFQLTTDYVRNTFNKVVLDHDEITYVALASVDEEITPDIEPDDSVITVESAEWLSQTNPDHPGKHQTRPHYGLEHGVLIEEGSPVFEDVLCEPSFYPDADPCPILASAASTSSQTAASPVAMNHGAQVVVPAEGTVNVPLAFEGTSWARMTVLFDAGTIGLGASFAATPLEPSDFFAFDALAATLADPVDGALTLTNSGAGAVTATVLVEIETQRRMTTSVTPSLAAPNQPVSVSATLDGAQLGDTLGATVIDGQGSVVQTLPLTNLGGGQYGGQIAGLPAGTYGIHTVSSAPTRSARSLLRVASGGVGFEGSFTEELVGTADGLADALVIRPAISVTAPGRYAVSARLVDDTGDTVATAGTDVDLVAGTNAPALSFVGQSIFASGQSGPYRVVDAVIAISDPLALEAEAADLGPTSAYSISEFEHFSVRFDLAGFEDTAVDTNGDGVFDELRVTGSAAVDFPGSYAINAQLRSTDQTQVAEFQTVASLVTGSNSFVLTFDGGAIATAGLDGPFAVEDLSVYSLTDSNAGGYLVSAHQTAAYTAAQFGGDAPIVTERVSESSQRGQGNGLSHEAYISADGRYVTFESSASDLVSGDTNAAADVFVHDRVTDTTSRLSVASGGTQGNGSSEDPTISPDGRYVAFRSAASNLASGDSNNKVDIFLHDRTTGSTSRVSLTASGAQASGASDSAVVARDGTAVVFRSFASNLVAGDTNGASDIFVRDIAAGSTTRVSVSSSGTQANAGSDGPTISDDGLIVAFDSTASNLVPADSNAVGDAFVHDRSTGVTSRVSVAADGTQGNGTSWEPTLDADGSVVAFSSGASNLVAGDTNAKDDVFVVTRSSGVVVRASLGDDEVQSTNHADETSLSADGSLLAFYSTASNLVAGDTNNKGDVFVRDLRNGTTTRWSLTNEGAQANDRSANPTIAADGRTVAFHSFATNLVPDDTNAVADVFVRGPDQ